MNAVKYLNRLSVALAFCNREIREGFIGLSTGISIAIILGYFVALLVLYLSISPCRLLLKAYLHVKLNFKDF